MSCLRQPAFLYYQTDPEPSKLDCSLQQNKTTIIFLANESFITTKSNKFCYSDQELLHKTSLSTLYKFTSELKFQTNNMINRMRS